MEFVMPKVSKDTMLICLKKDNMGGIAGRIKEWSSRIFWILVAYGIYYILNHIFLSSFPFLTSPKPPQFLYPPSLSRLHTVLYIP